MLEGEEHSKEATEEVFDRNGLGPGAFPKSIDDVEDRSTDELIKSWVAPKCNAGIPCWPGLEFSIAQTNYWGNENGNRLDFNREGI